jgi:spore germination cell wall hydrolase CwlJ-like protein
MRAFLAAVVVGLLAAFPARAELNPDGYVSQSSVDCVTMAVWSEARGEPVLAQISVANVVKNRVESGRYASSYCGVVRQSVLRGHCQFQGLCGRNFRRKLTRRDRESWSAASYIAMVVVYDLVADFSRGATCFHDVTVLPDWAWNNRPLSRYGRLTFYDCDGRRKG